MADDTTNLRVKKDVKQKLETLKSVTGESYSNIIQKLLEQSGGVVVDDVITIQREQIAFSLKYWSDNEYTVRDVTFTELMEARRGAEYSPKENWRSVQGDCITSEAEIIYKDSHMVVLRMANIKRHDGKLEIIENICHIELF